MRGRGRKIRKLKLISLSNTVNSRLAWPRKLETTKPKKQEHWQDGSALAAKLDSFVQSLVPIWGKKNLLLDLKCYSILLRWRMCTNTH